MRRDISEAYATHPKLYKLAKMYREKGSRPESWEMHSDGSAEVHYSNGQVKTFTAKDLA